MHPLVIQFEVSLLEEDFFRESVSLKVEDEVDYPRQGGPEHARQP
jgi:hypothetical protein